MKTQCVFCEVGTAFLSTVYMNLWLHSVEKPEELIIGLDAFVSF
jgi:hypothetical protein